MRMQEELRGEVPSLDGDTATMSGSAYARELWVRQRSEKLRVDVREIELIDADRDYVRLHTSEGRFMLHEKIGRLAARLDPDAFVRIHRSTIVRRNRIADVRELAFGSLSLRLASGEERRVSRTYVPAVRTLKPVLG